MGAGVPGPRGIVVDPTGPFRRQVLIEGPAERHVDQLDAATDAQHGQTPRAGRAKEGEFEPVPLAVYRAEPRRWLLAVEGGVDVLAAGEQEPVATLERPGRARVAYQLRQNERNASCAGHGAHVGRVDAGAPRVMPVTEHAAHGNAGRGTRCGHRSTESGKNRQWGSSIFPGSSWMPMSGTDTAPTDTIPMGGAFSTGGPS